MSKKVIISIVILGVVFASTKFIFPFQNRHLGSTLTREQLQDAEQKALCNDGSAPVYYVDLNPVSSEWLIYLEGGGDCYNQASCVDRNNTMSNLMTGALDKTPETITYQGFLSSSCDVNPAFCSASKIFFHYCSSDQWSGDIGSSEDSEQPWHFRGKNIVQANIKQIVKKYPQISEATRITLSGDSAGGMGTQNNGDRVGDLLKQLIPDREYDYKMVPDSGWFLTGDSFHNYPCTKTLECNLVKRTKLGQDLWNLKPDESCAQKFGEVDRYLCMFLAVEGVISEFQYPIMPVFYLYDGWQTFQDGILKNKVSQLTTDEQNWIKRRGEQNIQALTQLVNNGELKSVYAINCWHHVVTFENDQISTLTIKGVTLEQAVLDFLGGEESLHINDDCGGQIGCNSACPTKY